MVEYGDVVKASDPIAIVGSTGRSTGVDLNFECRVDGKTDRPERV